MQTTTAAWPVKAFGSVFRRGARGVALAALPFLFACSGESGSPVGLESPGASAFDPPGAPDGPGGAGPGDGSDGAGSSDGFGDGGTEDFSDDGSTEGSTDPAAAEPQDETSSEGSSAGSATPPPDGIWHVATSGSDAGAGTAGSPFRTVQKAVNAARAGETILVHGGTYNGVVLIQRRSNPADRPVTIRAAGDGTAVLTASFPARSCSETDPTRDRTVQIVDGSDNWILQDLEIVNGVFIAGANNGKISGDQVRNRNLPGRDSFDPDDAMDALSALGVDGADGIRILGNRITRRGVHVASGRMGRIEDNEIANIDCGIGAAIWINNFSDLWTIARNHVHHVAASDKHFMSEGIRMGRASSYNTVEDNLVEDLAGLGRGITTDVNASWNTIRRNRAVRTSIGFSQQAGGWGNVWERNVSESSRKFGFGVYTKSNQSSLPDASTPRYMRMSCNQSVNEPVGLRVGGVKESSFVNGGYRVVRLSDAVRKYWSSQGNTWDGTTKPPATNPPSSLGAC
jgi:hypothetical protein